MPDPTLFAPPDCAGCGAVSSETVAELHRRHEEAVTKERQSYADLCFRIVEAAGIEIPAGGMTAIKVVRALRVQLMRAEARALRMEKALRDLMDAYVRCFGVPTIADWERARKALEEAGHE